MGNNGSAANDAWQREEDSILKMAKGHQRPGSDICGKKASNALSYTASECNNCERSEPH
jgi:hypothetical protein